MVFSNSSILTGTFHLGSREEGTYYTYCIHTYQGHGAESSQQGETILYTPLSLDGPPHQSVELVSIYKKCYNYCKL